MPQETLTFEQLGNRLNQRAKAASATPTAVKAAADVPAAPEKDPQEKGTVSVPVDPAANPAKQNVPASASNGGVTPTLPAPAPAKTVSGEEAPSLTDKIAKVSAGIAGAITAMRSGKSASEAAPVNVTPATPPNDKKNTDAGKDKEAKPEDKAKDPASAPAPAPAADPTGAMPKAEPANADTKKAATDDVLIDPALYAKFASELATSEEGQAVMRKIAEAKFGAAIADDLIKAAMFMAEQEVLIEEAEASGAFAAEEAFKSASVEDQEAIIKLAHVHQTGMAGCADELEQQFYLEGAKAAAAMMEDPAMMGEEMPADYNGEGVSDTDIVAVLDQLVQAGKITPEEAAQALAILQGGGEGGEGAGAPPAGGEEMPPDDAPPEEKEAHAILKQANAIAAGETPAETSKK